MNFNQDVLRKNAIFYIGFFLFAFISLAVTQYFGRDALHLFINAHHNSFFDVFFKYFSKFAPIVFIIAILGYVIQKENYKVLFFMLTSYAINFIIATVVKRLFFIHVHRPTYYFSQKGIDLHLIEGVRSQIPFTFPSGHTAESFMFMLFICMITTSKKIQFFTVFIAIIMAYSRVYLSKHFLIDTVGGAFLGVFIITLLYYVYQPKNTTLLNKKIRTSN
ncbi:phosphatase PAP2 family protein [Polaribacter sp.]|uniref:phosphatase PAP2 family protein n=1 Tax=Polaribacter sp. TaxID=1920175 RepID=UPI003EFAF129